MHPHERRDPHHPLRRTKDYRPDGTRNRRWSAPERSYRLTYRRRPITTLLSTILAILLPATIVVAAPQFGATRGAPEQKRPVMNALAWEWSDGDTSAHRVFDSSDYRKTDLPELVVRVPVGETGLMALQFLQDGEWNDEWLAKPDSKGIVRMPFDPYCANDTWCDGAYRYRVRLGQLISYFDVEYWER